MDAVSKRGLVAGNAVEGCETRHLPDELFGKDIIGIENEDPIGRDTGLVERVGPLRRVVFEGMREGPRITKLANNIPCPVGAVAIDHDHILCPGQFCKYAPNVGFLVVGQDDGCDVIKLHEVPLRLD